MRIGVIGLGVIAPYFLRAIDACTDMCLTAVCDLKPDRLQEFPPTVATFTDHRALLGSGLVDGVIITLPNDLHAQVIRDALRARVHVCCEKPLTLTSAEAADLSGLARSAGTTLFTAFHRRYNHHVRKLATRLPHHSHVADVTFRYMERIEEHTGGDRWYLDPSRCGGGCVVDNGPNVLDTLMYLFGDLALTNATLGDVRHGVEFCADLDLVTGTGIPIRAELDWALPTGEIKDITVRLKDGTSILADMLDGFPGFKSSLEHEYKSIVTDFQLVTEGRYEHHDSGPAVVELVEKAYSLGRSKEQRLRMSSKEPATARLVKLLFHRREDRNMVLSPWASRCFRNGEIHELVTTTRGYAAEGDRIDSVGFLGFAEFSGATVIERGDEFWRDGRLIGRVVGFDESHAPNHYNIIVEVDQLISAEDIGMRIGEQVLFKEACS